MLQNICSNVKNSIKSIQQISSNPIYQIPRKTWNLSTFSPIENRKRRKTKKKKDLKFQAAKISIHPRYFASSRRIQVRGNTDGMG